MQLSFPGPSVMSIWNVFPVFQGLNVCVMLLEATEAYIGKILLRYSLQY
jgi:hypothetical protein